jgi:GWxTD domain-containing protein
MRVLCWMLGLVVACGGVVQPSYGGYTMDLDYATFHANDSLSYVEIYTAVQKSALYHETVGDSLIARFDLVMDLLGGAEPVLSDTFSGTYATLAQDSALSGSFFPHVFRYYLRPGQYSVRATLFQTNWRPRETVKLDISVKAYSGEELLISDIEFGCRLEIDTVNASSYVKNGVHLLPNATGFFGERVPMLYFYAETYGLDYDPQQPDSYVVNRRVVRADDGKELMVSRRISQSAGPACVVVDGFPVATLRTAAYDLELNVQSYRSGHVAVARKKFWIFREADFAAGRTPVIDETMRARFLASAPSVLDVVEPDSAIELMRYLLNKEELSRVKRLNADGQREFVRTYWAGRETNEPNAANKYFARVAEANNRFGILHRPGWKTDRGRVFILYGEPDAIDRNYMGASELNTEIWQFDRLEGGVIFVFVDYNEYGDMELVHSTMRGEVSNPGWKQTVVSGRRVQTGGDVTR